MNKLGTKDTEHFGILYISPYKNLPLLVSYTKCI